MALTLAHFVEAFPECKKPIPWPPVINESMHRFEADQPKRMAVFLAQFAHETSEFNCLEENLNYSGKRLMEVWPRLFPNLDRAVEYQFNPEKLANYVYADENRMPSHKLGNVNPGDGWRYRGRGAGLTGRDNYRKAGSALGLDLERNPGLASQPRYAALIFGWYWATRKARGMSLNDLADLYTAQSFRDVTRAINGALIGLKDRDKYWKRLHRILKV